MNRDWRGEKNERHGGDILSSLKESDGKMDKGDVPREYALILHGCLSVTMETVCVCVCEHLCMCALVTNIEL